MNVQKVGVAMVMGLAVACAAVMVQGRATNAAEHMVQHDGPANGRPLDFRQGTLIDNPYAEKWLHKAKDADAPQALPNYQASHQMLPYDGRTLESRYSNRIPSV